MILTVNAFLLMKFQPSPGNPQEIIRCRSLHPRIKRKGAQSDKGNFSIIEPVLYPARGWLKQ
jgi:hypothetical protein